MPKVLFIFLLLLVPIVITFIIAIKKSNSVISTFKGNARSKSYYVTKAIFFTIFIGSLVSIGAKPYIAYGRTNDFVFLVDVSRSMMARQSCNRLSFMERTKNLMRAVLSGVTQGRFGIFIFERLAFPITQMTYDHGYLEKVIEDGLYVGQIFANTDTLIENALSTVAKKKQSLPHIYGDVEYILLFSDGNYTLNNPSHLDEVLALIKDSGIKVITIGIGNESPTPVPIIANNTCSDNYYSKNNKIYITELNRELLQYISQKTNGIYFGEAEIIELIQYLTEETLENKVTDSSVYNVPKKEVSWLFVLIAAVSIFVYLLVDLNIRYKYYINKFFNYIK